jgi:S-adenosylmethionine:tRNA ribosyltransferase-isomerase
MKTQDFDYDLPKELIAQTPVTPRDSSRLMVIDRRRATVDHRRFSDLPGLLRPSDLLVYNESKVIQARLFARKQTGGQVEILLLRPVSQRTWQALVKGKHVHAGTLLTILEGRDGSPTHSQAKVVKEGTHGERLLAFSEAVLPLAQRVGTTPLPPYIHAPLKEPERYQTVFAKTPGSAAAPTAGLHFTPDLLVALREKGIQAAYVTLHIGLDTFRPVEEDTIEDHRIHTESCRITADTARQVNQARLEGRRVIAVGTTSVRVLETAALKANPEARPAPHCPYSTVAAFEGPTDLFIYPGHEFRVVDALITNFHLPRSTLLMLVAAFTTRRLLDAAYAEAISERYRFYSFGDAMLIT